MLEVATSSDPNPCLPGRDDPASPKAAQDFAAAPPEAAHGHATATASPEASISEAVLETLAARVRPGGVFLMLLRNDGSVAWHDARAGMFFLRYVLPMLQYAEPGACPLRALTARLSAQANIESLEALPGVTISAFACVQRRECVGMVILAGRNSAFDLTEETLRACSQLGLDATWLAQQAQQLPVYDDKSLKVQAKMLFGMMRDQVRLGALEQELDSLSGQLANTYEELSLIYQLSGGIKVNRRASDFFKQACLNLLEVMGLRGMGVALCGQTVDLQKPVLYGTMSLPPGLVDRLAGELMTAMNARGEALLINNLGSAGSRQKAEGGMTTSRDREGAGNRSDGATERRSDEGLLPAADRLLPTAHCFGWMRPHAQRLLAVPLQRQEQVLGVLFALDKHAGEFDSVDAKLLGSIANESAIYLENAMLFRDVHGLMMGLLHALTSAVDAKDPYTCGHSERVALLSRELAREADLSDAAAERIYMAGLLHDVGKIGVPESVLQKTGRLTDEEFELMKMHPRIGAKILSDIKQLEDMIPGVLHHHERYDGKGYPDGLAGEAIPYMGRIMCLADSFDAMTSNRTYREAMPFDQAMEEIRRCAGTQFDPALAEMFVNLGAEHLTKLLEDHREA